MNRLFGKPKVQAPAPSLGDAATSINTRIAALDEKIKGLDSELVKFKEQLKKTKPGTYTFSHKSWNLVRTNGIICFQVQQQKTLNVEHWIL